MLPVLLAVPLLLVSRVWISAAPVLPAGRPKEVASFQAHRSPIECLAFSPVGKTLCTGGRDGKVKIWDIASGKRPLDIQACSVERRRPGLGIVQGVAFSPDGKTFAACGDDQTVNIWDVSTGQNTVTLLVGVAPPLLFSPDGKILFTRSNKLDLEAKKTEPLMKNIKGYLATLAFDPKGKLLIATSSYWPDPPCIWLWDATTGKQTVTCKGYEKALMYLALSRDGKTLASAGYDQTVRLWNTTTGENVATFDKLPKRSSCYLTFSTDGKVLAMNYKGERESITDPGHVLLLGVPSGKILASLEGHEGVVVSVAFSPNSRLLASGDVKGIIKIWSLPTRYKVE